ncbi:MAG: hypothetical protein KF760_18570 [Candidatus Eremiobacteraeota bacterium]|nr:hypothetical protein [Candidatus Eremiobacteraeota bacterium]MCW5867342.1 hypothetical protein [Candidatus Eremiobacteraeota bacterium]
MLETVAGWTLLLLVLVLGINLLPHSLRAMSLGEQKVVAANLAQNLLQEQAHSDFEALQSTDLPPVDDYRIHLEVESPNPRLKKLTLRVRWTYRHQSQETVRRISVCKIPR